MPLKPSLNVPKGKNNLGILVSADGDKQTNAEAPHKPSCRDKETGKRGETTSDPTRVVGLRTNPRIGGDEPSEQ
jgi:hypothetical protein